MSHKKLRAHFLKSNVAYNNACMLNSRRNSFIVKGISTHEVWGVRKQAKYLASSSNHLLHKMIYCEYIEIAKRVEIWTDD
jgi:hypothetical protein